MNAVLKADDLRVRYGMIEAVRGVSLELFSGEVVAVLGANGAGKSSALNAVAGYSEGSVEGELEILGNRTTGVGAKKLVSHGVALVPEGRQIFAQLTVEENLRLGAFPRHSRPGWRGMLEEIYGMFPILEKRRKALGGLLSGGEQQMLAFGRALMSRPRIMLMDEPSMGLAPIMVSFVMDAIQKISDTGVTILLVEQNAKAAFKVASRAYVMENGMIVQTGESQALRDDPAIVATYLGTGGGPRNP